jgi:hypothetical protein
MNRLFKIPKELRDLLSGCYVDGDDLVIELSYKYQNKQVRVPFDAADIQGTLCNLEQKVKENTDISNHYYNQIELLIQDFIKSIEISEKDRTKKKPSKKER